MPVFTKTIVSKWRSRIVVILQRKIKSFFEKSIFCAGLTCHTKIKKPLFYFIMKSIFDRK